MDYVSYIVFYIVIGSMVIVLGGVIWYSIKDIKVWCKSLTLVGVKDYWCDLGVKTARAVGILLCVLLAVGCLMWLFGNDSSGTSVVGRSVVKTQVNLHKAITPYDHYRDSLMGER